MSKKFLKQQGKDVFKKDLFNPICPKGHDDCKMFQFSKEYMIYIFCYSCKKKYFEEDYRRIERCKKHGCVHRKYKPYNSCRYS